MLIPPEGGEGKSVRSTDVDRSGEEENRHGSRQQSRRVVMRATVHANELHDNRRRGIALLLRRNDGLPTIPGCNYSVPRTPSLARLMISKGTRLWTAERAKMRPTPSDFTPISSVLVRGLRARFREGFYLLRDVGRRVIFD